MILLFMAWWPLKRVFQLLASKILSGDVKEGSRVIVDRGAGKLVFRAEAHVVDAM